METKFELSQVCKVNDGKVTAPVEAICVSRTDETVYKFIYWTTDGQRREDWIRESEIVEH